MHRHLTILALAAALGACATRAERAPAPGPRADAPAVAVLDRSIAAHLRFLASDALNGRGSGTRDEWIAATYLGAQLEHMGFEPMAEDGGFVQAVQVQRHETTSAPTLVIGEQTLTHGAEMLVRAVSTPRVSAPLRRYEAGQPVIAGSAVVLPADAPPAALAAVSRAALVLQRETPAARARWTEVGARMPPASASLANVPALPPVPTWVMLDAASHDAALASAEGTTVTLAAAIRQGPQTTTWNAVGRLTGQDTTRASEVIVLSAHLDHLGARTPPADNPQADVIFNGADDDASGVVAVLELSQAIARGPRPQRTLVVAFFGSEEAGGFGSRYFVHRPTVPLTDIVANLQFEMIGRPDPLVPPGTLWLTGYERSTLGPALAAQGARLVQDPRPDQRFFERSDNIQFARQGVVAHTVSSFGLHGEYHQASDEMRHINIAHMREAITSLIAPVRWLIDGDVRPSWREGMRP